MLTFQQASVISQESILAAIFKSAFAVDPLLAVMAGARVQGKAHKYYREGTQISANFIAAGGAITPAAQTWLPVTANLQTVAASAQIAGRAGRLTNDQLDQGSLQMAALGRALARKLHAAIGSGAYATVSFTLAGVALESAGPFLQPGTGSLALDYTAGGTLKKLKFRAPGDTDYGDLSADLQSYAGTESVKLTSGDGVQWITVNATGASIGTADDVVDVTVSSSTNSFDGLPTIVTNLVTGSTSTGDAISFALLRTLVDAVDPGAGQLVFVCPKRTIRAVKDLYDAKGGTTPMALSLKNYGVDRSFLTFDDIPFLPNDYLSVTESKGGSASTRSSVYLLSLAPATGATSAAPYKSSGVCLLYGDGESMTTEDGPTMGVRVLMDPAPRDGSGLLLDATEYAVVGDYGLASYSEVASARLYGITN